MTSLKNRFILVAVFVLLLVLGFVLYTQHLVNQTVIHTQQVSQNSRDHYEMIRVFKNLLHRIESNVYQHSILSNNSLRSILISDITFLMNQLENISSHWSKINIDESQSEYQKIKSHYLFTVIELQQKLKILGEQVTKFLLVTDSIELKYPGFKLLTNRLVPLNVSFQEQVALGIEESEIYPDEPGAQKVRIILENTRYAWAQQISLVRLYVANRSGTFGDPVNSMKQNIANRELYIQVVKKNLKQLIELDKKELLGFQQSDVVARLVYIVKEYNIFFQKVSRIYSSNKWRADLSLLRNELRPSFSTIWKTVHLLENNLKEYSDYNTRQSNRTSSLISVFIWIFTTVILLLLISSYFTFDAFIRKPIQHIAKALDAVANGTEVKQEFKVHTNETALLVNAFHNMKVQINSRQNRLEAILENAAEGIITIDEHGIIETFNSAAQILFGYSANEILGKNISVLTTGIQSNQHDQYIRNFQRTGLSNIIGKIRELSAVRKDGTVFPISLKVSELVADGQKLYTALVEDISERKAMLDNLHKLAEHDSLTGLYNRFYFMGELERITERSRRNRIANCALFYIDLDNFKYVNDTLGHLAGDQLLIEVSSLFISKLRSSDLLARLGGDEFAVIVYDVTQIIAERVANTLREQIQNHVFQNKVKPIHVGCSIGITMLDDSIVNKEDLLSRADFACHAAKNAGRNTIHVYTVSDEQHRNNMTEDIGWTKRIKDALSDNRFILAKQAIYDIKKKQIEKYEVLLRMLDESGDEIMPAGFLPPAERFGLINDIDMWVVKHAIKELAKLNNNAIPVVYAINLSAKSFDNDDIILCIMDAITENGLQASSLIFEITETAAMADISLAIRFMEKLRNLGCQIALDDFGVGYSSFTYLKELPVDFVKIDGSFVKDIDTNDINFAVVKSMNDVAHAMGKKTVAEFVENEQCLKLLSDIGVDYAQGYYIGKPDTVIQTRV